MSKTKIQEKIAIKIFITALPALMKRFKEQEEYTNFYDFCASLCQLADSQLSEMKEENEDDRSINGDN